MNQKNPDGKLEKRIWSSYSKFGKGLTVVAAYCIADKVVQMTTGSYIHEYLGVNVPNPDVVVEGIRVGAREAIRQGIIWSAMLYNSIKMWQ